MVLHSNKLEKLKKLERITKIDSCCIVILQSPAYD